MNPDTETDTELAECERVVRRRARLEQVQRSGLDAMPTELNTLLAEYDRRGVELAGYDPDGLKWIHGELKRLRDQLDAVLALHPREVWGDEGLDGRRIVCGHCRGADEEPTLWPCATVQALGGAS